MKFRTFDNYLHIQAVTQVAFLMIGVINNLQVDIPSMISS